MNLKYFATLFLLLLSNITVSCTIGVISGDITADGRPIIFKTRGINSWEIEFKTIEPAEGYRYCANTYIDENIAWVGVNEVGFGIVQSAILNISIVGDDNGSFMTEALKSCVTVEDFAAMVDSSDSADRSTRANYGVMDSLGNIAMFECGHGVSMRYDPDTAGFIVRSNFALIGDMDYLSGNERMERAIELIFRAKDIDSLNPRYISQNIMGDLFRNGQDPCPLPFYGTFGTLDTGWIDTDSAGFRTISSHRTTSATLIQGILPGEDASLSRMYCYFGASPIGLPFLLMPKSPDTPPFVSGSTANMRLLAESVWDEVYHDDDNTLFDTHKLLDPFYNGMWEFSMPAIEWVYDTTEILFDEWMISPPSAVEITDLQDEISLSIRNCYSDILEVFAIQESLIIPENSLIQLYPNPFREQIFIDVSRAPELLKNVRLYDTLGNSVFSRKVRNSSSIILWKPDDKLPSGIYYLNLEHESGENETHRVLYMK